MKFTQEHLDILNQGINKILGSDPELIDRYEHGQFPRSDRVKDLQRRFCFDVFYASGVKIGDGVGTHGDIEGDYNDDHIYTALKAICPTITRRF